MPYLMRVTRAPRRKERKAVHPGHACDRGTVIGLVAAGRTREEILRAYPYLQAEDIAEALSYGRLAGGRRKSKFAWLPRVMTFPVRADAVAAGFVSGV
jgi:uncharacterized protein (DUF433 family)